MNSSEVGPRPDPKVHMHELYGRVRSYAQLFTCRYENDSSRVDDLIIFSLFINSEYMDSTSKR